MTGWSPAEGSVQTTNIHDMTAATVATTFAEAAFDAEGNAPHSRASWEIMDEIAALLAPDEVPAATREGAGT